MATFLVTKTRWLLILNVWVEEVVIVQMRVPHEEVACALILVLKLLVGTGHMRSFDAIPLRESAKRCSCAGMPPDGDTQH